MVLNIALEACRSLAILFHPITPFTSEKIWRMLNLPGQVEDQKWEDAGVLSLHADIELGEPEILFKKIEDDVIQRQLDKLLKAAEPMEDESKIAPLVEEKVSFDDVAKIDLRVADVIDAERVPKTDKLLKLRIKLGSEERTIVAGVAKDYAPEEIKGMQIIVVANLEPARIRGIESNGMLLAASDGDGLTLLTTAKPCKSKARVL